jgi:hypothetical protein
MCDELCELHMCVELCELPVCVELNGICYQLWLLSLVFVCMMC